MAVNGKRLFWTSIIIVELVLVYVLWKPYREHFAKPAHRVAQVAAPAPAVVRQPEVKAPPVVTASRKPWSGVRSTWHARNASPVVNAGLKSPLPTTTKPMAPQHALSPLESFWCQMSTAESKCDCKGKGEEQASNLVMRSGGN
jgi:hypothetical protein